MTHRRSTPAHIAEAIMRGDFMGASALGRKGGFKSAQKRKPEPKPEDEDTELLQGETWEDIYDEFKNARRAR